MLLPLLSVGKDKKQQEAKALLAKARELSDIRCQGCPPFRLKARVRSFEGVAMPVDGTYVLNWASPGKWREDLRMPDYSEIRLGLGDEIQEERATRFRPGPLAWLLTHLDIGGRLNELPHSKIKGLKEWQVQRGLSVCADYQQEGMRYLQRRCFLRDKGLLMYEESPPDAYEYDEYIPFVGKLFPWKIAHYVGGRLTDEMQVTELVASPGWQAGLFEPMTGSDVHETCRNPDPPRDVRVELPSLPDDVMGDFTVTIEYVVGVDGLPGDVVVHASDARLEPLVLKAFSKSRFIPAKCRGVPSETQRIATITIHHVH
jgi:hypothetical protein